MNPRILLPRIESLRAYIGWTSSDDARIDLLRERLLPSVADFVADFYDTLQRHPEAARVITGGVGQLNRLGASLENWLRQLLSGRYDEHYWSQRLQVGWRHVEIGLDQTLTSAAMSRLRMAMLAALDTQSDLTADERAGLAATLNRLLDLDLTLIQAAYSLEFQDRLRPLNEARLTQQRGLTRLGERALAGLDWVALCDSAVTVVDQGLSPDLVVVLEECETTHCWTVVSATGWSGHRQLPVEAGNDLLPAGADAAVTFIDLRRTTPAWLPFSTNTANFSVAWIHGLTPIDGRHRLLVIARRTPAMLDPLDEAFLASVGQLLSSALKRQFQEQALRDQADRLRRFLDQLPAAAILVTDGALMMNRATEQLLDCRRDDLTSLTEWRARGERVDEQSTVDSASGVVHWREQFTTAGHQIRLLEIAAFETDHDAVWLLTDLTESEARQQRTLQAERLAAIGQMITGLAHESRNALQRMRASMDRLEFEVSEHPAAREPLIRLEKAQDDLETLFDEVRNYAAPLLLECIPLNLQALWEEAWESLAELHAHRDATLHVSCESGCCQIQADRFRLVQVFRNFLENSLAACRDPLTVSVRVVPGSESSVRMHVADNGPGLTETARRRIFEPFFTTKTKGTGLGMAIAHRIVLAHGGEIALEPGDGSGARFVITLPRDGNDASTADRAR